MASRGGRNRGVFFITLLSALLLAPGCQFHRFQELNLRTGKLLKDGRYRQAMAAARRQVEYASRWFDRGHRLRLQAEYNLAVAMHAMGRYSEAEALHRSVLQGRIGLLRNDEAALFHELSGRIDEKNPIAPRLGGRIAFLNERFMDVADSLYSLAGVNAGMGRLKWALRDILVAVSICRGYVGHYTPSDLENQRPRLGEMLRLGFERLSRALIRLGRIRLQMGAVAEGCDYIEDASAIRNYLKEGELLFDSLLARAECAQANNDLTTAENLLRDAEGIAKTIWRETSVHHAEIAGRFARLYLEMGRPDEAEGEIRRLYETLGRLLPELHPRHGEAELIRAGFLMAKGHLAEAVELLSRLESKAKTARVSAPFLARIRLALARALTQAGLFEKAEEALDGAGKEAEGLGENHPIRTELALAAAGLLAAEGRYARALAAYDRLAAGLPPSSLVDVLEGRGWCLYQLGSYDGAQKAFESACRVLPDDHPKIADCLVGRAVSATAAGDFHGARVLVARALKFARRRFGNESERTAMALDASCGLELALHRSGPAEKACTESLEIRSRIYPPRHVRIAASVLGVAALRVQTGRLGDAERLLHRALEIRRAVVGDDHPAYGEVCDRLAEVYRLQGRYDEAEKWLLKAIGIARQFFGPDHRRHLSLLMRHARLLSLLGRNEQARRLARSVVSSCRSRRHQKLLVDALSVLAWMEAASGNFEKSASAYRKALSELQKWNPPDRQKMASVLKDLGEVLRAAGELDEAEECYRQAMISSGKLKKDATRLVAAIHYGLGRVAEQRGDEQEAMKRYESALGELSKGGLDLAGDLERSVTERLADILAGERRYRQRAAAFYSRLLESHKERHGVDHPGWVILAVKLADTYKLQGRFAEAAVLYGQAVEVLKRHLGGNHPLVGRTLLVLADCNRRLGRVELAERQKVRALEILAGKKER